MRKLFLLVLIVFFSLFQVTVTQGAEVLQAGKVNLDGASVDEAFLLKDGKAYVPLKAITSRTNITLKWDAQAGLLVLTYPDFSSVRANTKTDRLYEQDTFSSADFLLSGGKTYINVQDLSKVAKREVVWDSGNRELFVYQYAYLGQNSSIMTTLPYEGLAVNENSVSLSVEGLPQASWQMEGELKDLRLINSSTQGGMEEIQVAAFYIQPSGVMSQLIITQRKLPSGDRMVFTRAYCPQGQQVLTLNTEADRRVYGSKAYHYIDRGALNESKYEEPFQPVQRLIINAGTSVDQWHILSQEDLTLVNPIAKRAWNASLDYHGSNGWVTPEGTYRSTPAEYLSKLQFSNQNINLQASTPLLLLDALKVQKSPLLDDFVHSAKFTLLKIQRKDGFWRTGLNVAYLNRAYNLGPDYIDTRMSVDASLFLVKYGLMFNDQESKSQGAHFKQFFSLMKAKKAVYSLQGGVLYPDYYSESQKNKSLVSLNHSLYEMNYLYTLYNELGDNEAKVLADEMRLFIKNSAQRWVAPNGDLYYALSPEGKYYAEDYVNITYVDLFVANGLLDYMEVKDAGIKDLLQKKGAYLDEIQAPQVESNLDVDTVLEKFDTQTSRKGDFFFPYPLEVKMSETGNQAYFACGTYHWIMGAESITYLGKTYALDPMEKYIVVLTKGGFTVRGYGEKNALSNTER